jgi:sec-independent protein translocase protein TatB
MFNLGPEKVMMVLFIALIVLGPDKLPNAARQVGKYLNEFRRISQGFQNELRNAIDMADIQSDPTTKNPPTESDPAVGAAPEPGPTLAPAGEALTEPTSEAETAEADAPTSPTIVESTPADAALAEVSTNGNGHAPSSEPVPVEASTNANSPASDAAAVEASTNGNGNGTPAEATPVTEADNDEPIPFGIPQSVWELDANNVGPG